MFKSKLQEFCQKRRTMSLPVYEVTKQGPSHDLCFQATVIIDDMQFHSDKPWKTSKDAQNDAARVALCYLSTPPPGNDRCVSDGGDGGGKRETGSSDVSFQRTSQLETKEANQTPLSVAPPVFKDDKIIGGSSDASFTGTLKPETKEANQTPSDGALPFLEDDSKFEGAKHLYKNLLQSLAQKRNLTLPIYFCERVGLLHASRFRCKVRIGTQTFESQEFFTNTKEAEHAAAKVALMSLSLDGIQEDGPSVYKNLLQEFCQKQGCPLPVYATTKSGEPHAPIFISTVEVKGTSFAGEESRTKKQAEMSAAKVAYRALRETLLLWMVHFFYNEDKVGSLEKICCYYCCSLIFLTSCCSDFFSCSCHHNCSEIWPAKLFLQKLLAS
ncbi:double-stranded RNA-binding protein 1-like isoform X2 [Carica papaya]|uniref:double-stranded RNA-binding protein 1-like isoform X2 n=1 Tax=Carica papaya TaxID=3649 RepID=UPI000B8CBDD2|nr:double-stranded RNA-binding protein 1-like isoform X2 [Carica papaya]